MFGMGFGEILVVAIIAILFLGPDKLPEAMVKIARLFKTFKSSINEVKTTFEQEMKIQDLKEEALAYKQKLEETAVVARKTISFDELEEIKKSTSSVSDSLREIENSVKESVSFEPQNTPASLETKSTPIVEDKQHV